MERIKRRAFMQTALAGVGAGVFVNPNLASASSHPDNQYEKIYANSDVRLKAMTMERIDTHSHYSIRNQSELKVNDDFINSPELVGSSILATGSQKLYGINPGLFLRPDSSEEIFRKAADLRAEGPGEALETAMDTANISTQLLFNHGGHPKYNKEVGLSSRVQLLNYVDNLIVGGDRAFSPDGRDMEFNYYDAICRRLGELKTMSDYLNALDADIDSWKDYRVVAMKVGLAYSIGLNFSDPSLKEAQSAFAKKRDMSPEELTIVHHYAFRHTLLACQRNGLPVVVHTGFQIWGHADLQVSNPMNLHNLLIDKRYKDITWVLLHGGNPYVGETTYLARMFPNVFIDFTWISWMTRVRFHMALSEWIEIVPLGKFCWGSDSSTPETIVGIGEISRERIANVLEDQIAHRIIDEKIALDFLEHTYVKTPKRLFQL